MYAVPHVGNGAVVGGGTFKQKYGETNSVHLFRSQPFQFVMNVVYKNTYRHIHIQHTRRSIIHFFAFQCDYTSSSFAQYAIQPIQRFAHSLSFRSLCALFCVCVFFSQFVFFFIYIVIYSLPFVYMRCMTVCFRVRVFQCMMTMSQKKTCSLFVMILDTMRY